MDFSMDKLYQRWKREAGGITYAASHRILTAEWAKWQEASSMIQHNKFIKNSSEATIMSTIRK